MKRRWAGIRRGRTLILLALLVVIAAAIVVPMALAEQGRHDWDKAQWDKNCENGGLLHWVLVNSKDAVDPVLHVQFSDNTEQSFYPTKESGGVYHFYTYSTLQVKNAWVIYDTVEGGDYTKIALNISHSVCNVKLDIEKQADPTSSTPLPSDAEFSVRITGTIDLYDYDGGSSSGLSPLNYDETVTLKVGEKKSLWVYPGSYSVQEVAPLPTGWSLVSISPNPAVVSYHGSSVTVVVKNKYEAPKGALVVTKRVEGESGWSIDQLFNITVTGPNSFSENFNLKHGESKSFSNLEPGEYTVSESTPANFVASGTGPVQVVADATANVTVTNTYTAPRGSLTIEKVVNGDPNPPAIDFTVTVTGPSYPGGHQVVLKAGEKQTLSNLLTGAYTVSENAPANFVASVSPNDGSVTVAMNQDTTVTVTNTFTQERGSLTIRKVVVVPDDAAQDVDDFTFEVRDPQNAVLDTFTLQDIVPTTPQDDRSRTYTGLLPGTYTVTELTTGTTFSTVVSVDGGANQLGKTATPAVKPNETAIVVFTNTFVGSETSQPVRGQLTVEKVVVDEFGQVDDAKTFSFTVTGPEGFSESFSLAGGESKTLTDLLPGQYTVTEDTSGLGAGWTVSPSAGIQVEIVGGDTKVVTVTNSYDPRAKLIVKKHLVGDTPPGIVPADFVITVTGPNGFVWNVTGSELGVEQMVMPGLYTVAGETWPVLPETWDRGEMTGTLSVEVVVGQTGVLDVNNSFRRVFDTTTVPTSTSTTESTTTTTASTTTTTVSTTTTTVSTTTTTQPTTTSTPTPSYVQTGGGGTATSSPAENVRTTLLLLLGAFGLATVGIAVYPRYRARHSRGR